MIHIVQAGDTLYQLSKKYGISVDSLKTTNQLRWNGLWIGQKLTIPISSNDKANTSNPSIEIYTVQAGDSLYKIARKFDTTIDELKRINGLNSNLLSVGQQLKIPSKNSNSNTSSNSGSTSNSDLGNTTDTSPSNWAIYTVKKGDSLYKIATEFKTTADKIRQINRLSSNTLYIGQELKVPNSSGSSSNTNPSNTTDDDDDNLIIYTVKAGDSIYMLAWIYNTSVSSIQSLNRMSNASLKVGQRLKIIDNRQNRNTDKEEEKDTNSDWDKDTTTNSNTDISDNTPVIPTTGETEYEYYRVKAGDSLWSIAQSFQTTTFEIKSLNSLSSNSLSIGQLLKVRQKTGSTSDSSSNTNPNTGTDSSSNVEEGLTFQYQFTIQDSVGACDQNLAEDVRKVQERLLKLGFLSQANFDAEQSPFSNTQISRWQLPRTIDAIKVFEKEVLQVTNPSGCILPNHDTLMFLNTAVAPVSSARLQKIKAAYNIFNFKAINGTASMKDLQKPVGATNFGNLKTDVSKLQERLVQLGNLSKWHGETPKTSQVTPSKIHHTVAALKRFQEQRVSYWHGKTDKVGNSAKQYKYGIAVPNDLTHHLLQNFTDYRLTFPLPNNPAKRDFAEFRNFVKASFTADVTGIAYFGKVKPENIALWEYRKLGLNNTQARALQYVSQHEGNFDAINSYDKALFSWGFIQFAGVNGGLVPMLAMMKHLQPKTFEVYFQPFGIDVEYSVHTLRKDIRKANLVIFDRQTGKLNRGLEAEEYLKANKLLFGVFIRAAYAKDVQLAQIRAAKDKYVLPALNIKLDLRVPVVQKLSSNKRTVQKTYMGSAASNYKTIWEYRSMKQKGRIRETVIDFNKMPISKVIRSEMGMTVLIDLTVNQWIHKTRDLFMEGIYKIAMQNHYSKLSQLQNINELQVLKVMEPMAESKLRYRIQNIRLNSGLSTLK